MDEIRNKYAYNAICRNLLTNKTILAHIFKKLIPEYKMLEYDEVYRLIERGSKINADLLKVLGLQNEDNDPFFGRVEYDLLVDSALSNAEGNIHLLINIEMQLNENKPYSLISRGIYYIARMISYQKDRLFKKDHYQDICKVYSIWICPRVKGEKKNTITTYSFFEKFKMGNYSIRKKDYDKMEIVLVRLGNNEIKDDLDLLNELFNRNSNAKEKIEYLEKEYGITFSEDMKGEIGIMCDLANLWEARGRYEGKLEGKLEGIEVGKIEGRLEIIKKFMMITQKNMEEVMEMLELSDLEKEECKNYLN